ncbi:uncharacterized protein BX664DRAFT_361015 [Halteromyces radiatus]|uniref:uncharacterized protein n=1 Tax=Halteromyces radiatus TaxID=101107 RepID=UPI00221FCA79|nr:uncharacterized protein BX664DRAFT_361015 [Halteromyces radiatus]KAI8082711.1 hypothetical protein BX664DRAFT_361015 [Halteromyces radiatus]
MDMSEMSMEDTPLNGNEMYSQTLVGIICAFIFLLIIRHHILLRPYIPLSTYKTRSNNTVLSRLLSIQMPIGIQTLLKQYQAIDRLVVNKFTWSLPFLPPIGVILICLVLITTILPLLLLNTDLSLNSNRAGFLTIGLVPFLLASTGKYSALALLTGMSSARLNVFHRILGWAIVILATVHMSCMLSAWAPFPSFMASQLTIPKVRYGLAGYGCLCVVVLGSLYPIRVYKYEFFLCTHILAFGFIGAISKHTPYAMRYFISGIICYLLNLLAAWCVQARLARVRTHVLDHDCTRLSLRLSSPMAHAPGQFIYVCIPRLSAFQWHPFTITNIQPQGEGFCDTMVEVHATVRGDYTRQLYKMAGHSGDDDDDDWIAFLSGPCGRALSSTCPKTMLTEQTVIVLANAGAGVTYGIRLIRELASTLLEVDSFNISSTNEGYDQHHPIQQSHSNLKTRDIYFIWSVRHAGAFKWFGPELQSYKDQFDKAHTSNSRFPRLHLILHHTGTDEIEHDFLDTTDVKNMEKENNEIIRTTEPDVMDETCDELVYENKVSTYTTEYSETKARLIKTALFRRRVDPKECLALSSDSDTMGLFVCGSTSFNRSFKNVVASTDVSRSCLLDFHCEEFEY